jgi:hypothetical protein
MMPFENLIDSRHASKDAIYDQLVGPAVVAASKIAADRTLICGRPYVEVATPVAKPRGPKDPQSFNDAVPGASQRESMPPPIARETPRGVPKQGPAKPVMGLNAPSRGGPVFGERERAATGVLLVPPPFTQYIAPH